MKLKAALAALVLALGLIAAPAGAALADTTCTVTVVNGPDSNCGPYDYPAITVSNGYNTYVGIDGWACGPADQNNPDGTACGDTNLTAVNPGNFTLTTTEPAGNTGVLMYPSAYQLYNDIPVSGMTYLRSGFTESMPHNTGTVAHAAYDMFFSNTPANGSDEVMIIDDSSSWGPGGSAKLGHATFNNEAWTAWEYGGPGGELIWRLDTPDVSSGTVHILAMLRWMQKHGYLDPAAQLSLLGYGWEICSTGGVPETFSVSNLWVHNG